MQIWAPLLDLMHLWRAAYPVGGTQRSCPDKELSDLFQQVDKRANVNLQLVAERDLVPLGGKLTCLHGCDGVAFACLSNLLTSANTLVSLLLSVTHCPQQSTPLHTLDLIAEK